MSHIVLKPMSHDGKCPGSIQEGSFEVRGKKYKRMYGKTPRFLVVLGVWNEESCCFEIDNMVDEVVSEFEKKTSYFKDPPR